MAITDFGNLIFSVNECVIAPYDYNGDSIGTPVDLDTVSMADLGLTFDSDAMKYKGANRRSAHVLTGGTLKLTAGGIPLDVLDALGWANATTGVTPNQVTESNLAGGGSGMAYVSVGFRGLGEQGDDVHMGVIAAKLTGITGLKADQNKYGNVDIDLEWVIPDGKQGLYIEAHETAAAINLSTLFS